MDGIRFWKDTFFPSLTPLILTPKYSKKIGMGLRGINIKGRKDLGGG